MPLEATPGVHFTRPHNSVHSRVGGMIPDTTISGTDRWACNIGEEHSIGYWGFDETSCELWLLCFFFANLPSSCPKVFSIVQSARSASQVGLNRIHPVRPIPGLGLTPSGLSLGGTDCSQWQSTAMAP